jgi:hypothetical protein
VSENERVLESVNALRIGDVARFGQLMNASHESLRDDYEVSAWCPPHRGRLWWLLCRPCLCRTCPECGYKHRRTLQRRHRP